MATQTQLAVLTEFVRAATAAGHIFPEMAACEGVVETAWGSSTLYLQYKNVFGQKGSHPPLTDKNGNPYGTVTVPSNEYVEGALRLLRSEFVIFPTVMDAFRARMELLHRLSGLYPAYAEALKATKPEDYVTHVSRAWSTDPNRAATCTAIYRAHIQKLGPVLETA